MLSSERRLINACGWCWHNGSEKWVLIWKTGRRSTVVQVVTEWLIIWVTNRERLCDSCSWATDSREQCNLEKYRTWDDPGQVTWLQEEMTDRISRWSNGNNRDALGKEKVAEALGGQIRNGWGWDWALSTPRRERGQTVFPGWSRYNFDLLPYSWPGDSEILLKVREKHHLPISKSCWGGMKHKLNIVCKFSSLQQGFLGKPIDSLSYLGLKNT